MTKADPRAQASIAAGLIAVRARISAACERAGRDPASVRLVGVTKTVPAARILEALEAGLGDIGENYVQEAAAKRAALGTATGRATWHMIGHLQSNKVRAALDAFDIIQTVDSAVLAESIARRATRTVPILLEVNAGGEASKSGFQPAEVSPALKAIGGLPNVEVRGLMTVAPAQADGPGLRACFGIVRELAAANGLRELSMGMSGDFEQAIEEGATIVRIGRAIFGERAPGGRR